jgi:hypothetical protein
MVALLQFFQREKKRGRLWVALVFLFSFGRLVVLSFGLVVWVGQPLGRNRPQIDALLLSHAENVLVIQVE